MSTLQKKFSSLVNVVGAMSEFIPSKYNKRIFEEFDNTNSSIIISATSGSGKTTQIIELLKRIPKGKDVIFLAFNRDIANELKTRVPPGVQATTIHSFGCRQMFRHFPGITINENKYFGAALRLYKMRWHRETVEKKWYYCYRITRLVELMCLTLTLDEDKIEDLAMEYDIGVFEHEVEHALQLYKVVYKDTHSMNFTDMVFQVAIRSIKLPKFDYVILDELQDISNCHIAILKKIIKPVVGRFIGVGDPNQAIYGFAGANHESFKRVQTLMPDTINLPLSISYRCPKAVVALAQTIVPSIEARPGAPKGKVRRDGTIDEIDGKDFVLCRNTRPLVQVFRVLIKQGKKANIKGREVGIDMVSLINKTKATTIEQLLRKFDILIFELKSKLYRKGCPKPEEHPKFLKLVEKREIIEMLAEDYPSVKLLCKRIEEIFVDKDINGIMLSTIHRVKGLETDNVYFLNSFLIPSQYSHTPAELQQEQNLKFVCITRAKKQLIYLDVI